MSDVVAIVVQNPIQPIKAVVLPGTGQIQAVVIEKVGPPGTPPETAAIYDPDIDALTGTADALETVETNTLDLKSKITFVIDDSEQSWLLKSGAAGAGEVAPLDYNVSTNNKHWTKVGGF